MTEQPLFSSLSSWANIFTEEDKTPDCETVDSQPLCPYCNRPTHTDEQGWYCYCGAYGDNNDSYNPFGNI
ncbi:MAG TPA: hypothetical protein VK211_05265 [Kamptonema sp.]|nr:hypothetical protein [Kamptonema sp.]